MPLAGRDPRARAHAHYGWARRYADESRIERAIPHFGRALHYSRAAFGERDARLEPYETMVRKYFRFTVEADGGIVEFREEGPGREAYERLVSAPDATLVPLESVPRELRCDHSGDAPGHRAVIGHRVLHASVQNDTHRESGHSRWSP
jgi:hypothetical protein